MAVTGCFGPVRGDIWSWPSLGEKIREIGDITGLGVLLEPRPWFRVWLERTPRFRCIAFRAELSRPGLRHQHFCQPLGGNHFPGVGVQWEMLDTTGMRNSRMAATMSEKSGVFS